MSEIILLYFQSEARSALNLAHLIGSTPQLIRRHNFPDGEFKLQLPALLTQRVVLFHSLDHPNEKLIELLLAARTARQIGVQHLTLVAPYLAYMRQDIAFIPGEVVSQRIIGDLLASLFDAVITVDPHLHRISSLEAAVPVKQALVVSAAPILGDLAFQQRNDPFLIGPDGESEQWVVQASLQHCLDYGVAQKVRHGDLRVDITLPMINVQGRSVVLIDDIVSSGQTLACAAGLLLAAGAKTVDVAVTHALFSGDAFEIMKRSGIDKIWSTDSVEHSSNVVSVLPDIANAFNDIVI